MSSQMIGNKVVHPLSQILVGRLESNSREVGLEGSLVILPEGRLLQLGAPSDPPGALLSALNAAPQTLANQVCMTVHSRPASPRSPPNAGLRLRPRGREGPAAAPHRRARWPGPGPSPTTRARGAGIPPSRRSRPPAPWCPRRPSSRGGTGRRAPGS